ncbi:MAG: signal transduction histidine kinase [Chthonomonadales bacterium]|nr:signal transduction histidine kinase [Chthonomonadales bacterium]
MSSSISSRFILLNERIHALTKEVAARRRAEADLVKRQVEIEALNVRLQRAIAETHHRVKNNLQAVISLLELQKEDAADDLLPIQSLNESLLQIKTIALVHDVLSHEDPQSEVDVQRVLKSLVELLAASLRSSGKSVSIHLQAQSLWLSTQAATALALVVNELISNAYKHGCQSERIPTNDGISVRLSLHDREALLEVEDCGPGFPPGFDVTTDANLGLSLVQSLVENDLRGHLTFGAMAASAVHDGYPGGKVCIRFPAPPKTE